MRKASPYLYTKCFLLYHFFITEKSYLPEPISNIAYPSENKTGGDSLLQHVMCQVRVTLPT